MIKIKAFGGYSKIGKSMTAVEVDDDIVICDMGADIEKRSAERRRDLWRASRLFAR